MFPSQVSFSFCHFLTVQNSYSTKIGRRAFDNFDITGNHFYVSDISDTGLMGLCGISLDQPELMDDSASADETSTSFGCPLLTRLGVTDCQHISHAGVKQAKKLIV